MGRKVLFLAGLVLVMLLIPVAGGCSSTKSFDRQLGSIVKPYRFSIAGWELKAIPAEIKQWLFGPREPVSDEARTVIDYFSRAEQARALNSELQAVNDGGKHGDIVALQYRLSQMESQDKTMQETVAGIISGQIKEVLASQGIFNPIIGLRFGFPPISFKLDNPPHVLIISPRDRIETLDEITLNQDMSLGQVEDVEKRVDALGVSSLVVEPGGFGGTYPTFVINNAGLRYTLDAATEEWLHQYLAFKPLGFRYVLDLTGISKNYDIVTMNETVAGIISKEIGAMVYDKYYASQLGPARTQRQTPGDFNLEMRDLRREVDKLLGEGKIEDAEKLMEQKRQELVSKGYHIRKLNQAYFAFYGSYGDSPTSISPIGITFRKLRAQSTSLKDFLDVASAMTSRQDLVSSAK